MMTRLVAACCLAAAAAAEQPERGAQDLGAAPSPGPHDDWAGGGALQLLDTLRRQQDSFYEVPHEEARGFVRESDLGPLIEALASTEPCAAFLQTVSAHLPSRPSTVGHEAGLMIEAFRQGYYPLSPASDLQEVDAEELRQWWHVWQRLQPARGWSTAQLRLESDVAYVEDFAAESGWQPLVRLPMLLHHSARIEFANLDDFGPLRFGRWQQARITFRLLKTDVQPYGPPRGWNTTYTAEILRVE